MNENSELQMSEESQHPLELTLISLGATTTSGASKGTTPLGAKSHVPHGSPEALARKYALNVLAEIPEKPNATLSGATVPSYDIMTEKVEHRFVIYLNSQGHTPAEIAKKTDYSEQHVRQILAQPWARRQSLRLLEESDAKKMVEEMIEQSAVRSVQVMIQIRDDPKTPANTRVTVCDKLLDRFLGKALQPIVAAKPIEDDNDKEINKRLEELKAREAGLVGRPKLRNVPVTDLTLQDARTPNPAA